jgi:hypothetical protein
MASTTDCPDTEAPTAPTSLAASNVTQTGATLTWKASRDNVGVTGYDVYRNGSKISTANALSSTQTGLSCGTAYTFAVAASDAAGNKSPQSQVITTTAACPTPKPACSDGVDNDADGKTDYPNDPGCVSASDSDEVNVTSTPTTITSSQLAARAAVDGAVIDGVTVSGSGNVAIEGSNVTIRNSHFSGLMIEAFADADGFQLLNSTVTDGGFNLWGVDHVLIQGNLLDGGGTMDANKAWDLPSGDGPTDVTIRDNTFQHYHGSSCSVHSEALMIGGYVKDWLIEGNTFTDNGCTSHIFFTYFGTQGANGYQSAQVPRNVCVRGNTFGPTAGAYFDINYRAEVQQVGPAATQIKIDPDQGASTTNPEFNSNC